MLSAKTTGLSTCRAATDSPTRAEPDATAGMEVMTAAQIATATHGDLGDLAAAADRRDTNMRLGLSPAGRAAGFWRTYLAPILARLHCGRTAVALSFLQDMRSVLDQIMPPTNRAAGPRNIPARNAVRFLSRSRWGADRTGAGQSRGERDGSLGGRLGGQYATSQGSRSPSCDVRNAVSGSYFVTRSAFRTLPTPGG